MNFLLTILKTPVEDPEFVVRLTRYMEPIVESNPKFVQYDNGVLLYNFATILDNTTLRDYLKGIPENFGCFFVLSEMNENMAFCFKEGTDLFIFGPEIHYEKSPYIYEIIPDDTDNTDEEDDEESESDDVVQKWMQKYRIIEKEPTLDEILEKIHEKGIDSLSIQEIAILKTT